MERESRSKQTVWDKYYALQEWSGKPHLNRITKTTCRQVNNTYAIDRSEPWDPTREPGQNRSQITYVNIEWMKKWTCDDNQHACDSRESHSKYQNMTSKDRIISVPWAQNDIPSTELTSVLTITLKRVSSDGRRSTSIQLIAVDGFSQSLHHYKGKMYFVVNTIVLLWNLFFFMEADFGGSSDWYIDKIYIYRK